MRVERLYAIRRSASVGLKIEEGGTNTLLKEALRNVIELCDYIDTLRDGIKTAVGNLDDPTGGTHVDDMRAARQALLTASKENT